MSQQNSIDHLSLSTTPIFLWKGKELVSQGTGFYYLYEKENLKILCLVTNYHVLTGWAPHEQKPPKGDSIAFHFHKSLDNPGDVKVVRLSLNAPNGKPVWISDPKFPDADYALVPIPVSLYQGCQIRGISEQWAKSNMKIRPTSNITLIGYPYGFYDKKNSLPIWKTGNVASEPSLDFNGNPLFLVDVSAFPGMSGSPVFGISYGMYETEDGATSVGGAKKFLGIYSSMEMFKEKKFLEEIKTDSQKMITHEESLELGHVWKSKLILDTLENFNFEKYLNERGMNNSKNPK